MKHLSSKTLFISLLIAGKAWSFVPASFTTPAKASSSSQSKSQKPSGQVKTATSLYSFATDEALWALDNAYHTYPFLAAFLTCSIKAHTADFIAQTREQPAEVQEQQEQQQHTSNPKTFDWGRNLAFVLYGGLYQGMGQCFIYTHIYPALFGSEPTLTSVLTQASIDNFLLAPFFCLPTVYTIKSLLTGGTSEEGLAKYADHVFSQQILLRYWSLWFPVQCINFAFVPDHLQVPFGAFVSFFWMCLLSSLSSKENAAPTNRDSPAMTSLYSKTLESVPAFKPTTLAVRAQES